MGSNSDLIVAFVEESVEGLDSIDQDLIDLEQRADDADLVNKIFRVMHSMKGTGGFFDLDVLVNLAHAAESLLDRLRNGKVQVDDGFVNLLLESSAALRTILSHLEQTETEGPEDYERLIANLQTFESTTAKTENSNKQVSEQQEHMAVAPKAKESSIRVDVKRMDRLMNLVGELVLSRNQILQQTKNTNDPYFAIMAQRLSHVTSDLQEIVMQTRMQPIERIWGRYPRIVRTLAMACGKNINLHMSGENTELDKTLLEIINDPLTHLLRNSIDHGIEGPAERIGSGKREEGSIYLNAFQEGGQIIIEISDDGKGIDPEAIKKSALEKGLVTQEQVDIISDKEAVNLIFMPGFSTAEEVSDISGRGVGMDVVKDYIERAGGVVEITSSIGKGTTTKIKLPLTLAIMPSLVLRSDDGLYVVHQANLLELIHIESEDVLNKIEYIRNVPVYRLRDKILPLVILGESLKQKRVGVNYELFDQNVNIVVLQVGSRQFGLVVDEVYDSQEVVVKPLNHYLQTIPIYAGMTLLGNGRIALILDVSGLASSSGVLSDEIQNQLDFLRDKNTVEPIEENRFILFNGEGHGQMAVPMFSISRLVIVKRDQIQDIGQHYVMQYQSKILPMVSIKDSLPDSDKRIHSKAGELIESDDMYVAVYEDDHNKFGLILGDMVDVLEVDMASQSKATREGVMYTLIINDDITEVLDIKKVIEMTYTLNVGTKEKLKWDDKHV